jgi:hypothetical protein
MPPNNKPIAVALIGAAALVIAALIGYLATHKGDPALVAYTGKVKDAKSFKPVGNASVAITEDQKVPQRFTTDSEGVFYAKLSKDTQTMLLEVTAAGYQNYSRRGPTVRTGSEDILLEPMRPPPPVTLPKKTSSTPKQDNSVHVAKGAKIEQQSSGDCSPNIVGGSNTVNCAPKPWSLTDAQRSKWVGALTGLPAECATLLVIADVPDEQSSNFAKQLFDSLHDNNRVNRLGHFLSGSFPKGVIVEVHDDNDSSAPIAQQVISAMKNSDIPVADTLFTNSRILRHEVRVIVGYRP